MITRRILINTVVFFALSLGLVVYGAVTLFGNPMDHPRTLSADLPDAGGLRTGFSASHDGVVVGTVSKLELRDGGVRVTVELDPGITVPTGVEARVVRASAVGEQRLDLVSTTVTPGKPLADGAVVPVAEDPIPPDVADVLDTTNDLFDALPADDLNTVVHELAVGVDGRADDLKSINRSLADINDDIVEVEPDLEALLADAPGVLDDFTEMSPGVHQALANSEELTAILAARDEDLVSLLENGGDVAEVLDRVLLDNRASLTCIVGDVQTLSAGLQGQTLQDLDRALQINTWFFGAIGKVAVRGDSADVGYGPAQDDALWLRTRLLIPPQSPAASRYSPPRAPRPVVEGEPCVDAFGEPVVDTVATDGAMGDTPSPGRPSTSDRALEPSDARGAFPPGPPVDRSPAQRDEPRDLTPILQFLIGAAVIGGLVRFAPTIRRLWSRS